MGNGFLGFMMSMAALSTVVGYTNHLQYNPNQRKPVAALTQGANRAYAMTPDPDHLCVDDCVDMFKPLIDEMETDLARKGVCDFNYAEAVADETVTMCENGCLKR